MHETDKGRGQDDVLTAISTRREIVEEAIDSKIHEISKRGTRAATVEIEEYRRCLQQQRDELKGNI